MEETLREGSLVKVTITEVCSKKAADKERLLEVFKGELQHAIKTGMQIEISNKRVSGAFNTLFLGKIDRIFTNEEYPTRLLLKNKKFTYLLEEL